MKLNAEAIKLDDKCYLKNKQSSNKSVNIIAVN